MNPKKLSKDDHPAHLAIKDMLAEPQIPNKLRVKIIKMMGYVLKRLNDNSLRYGALFRNPLNAIVNLFEYQTGQTLRGVDSPTKIEQLVYNAGIKELVTIASLFLEEMLRYPHFSDTILQCDLIAEMNRLFREHKVKYEFAVNGSGKIHATSVRSKYLHGETVAKPITLLADVNFRGPLEEFEDAIEALDRQGTDKAINEALKAFESTMKGILQELGRQYSPKWGAKDLIQACIDADIIPTNLESFSAGLRTVSESGLPTIRNMPGPAHGTGRDPKDIERSYAQFALNLCGSYIVFLIERYKEKK
jgi:hypothetical protein